MTDVLVKKTHFTNVEIEKLFQLYRDHSEHLDSMDRNTFREFLHDIFNMTDDILMDRIFKFFDTVNDGNIRVLSSKSFFIFSCSCLDWTNGCIKPTRSH